MENLFIDVNWPLPIAHSHRDSFLVYNHKAINVELKKHGMELKNGLFTSEEDEIIINNWNRFKITYEICDPSLFFMGFLPKSIFSNEEKKKFAQFIGYGLDNRSLRSIYERFDDIFGIEIFQMLGCYTSREEQVIEEVNKLPSSTFNKNFNKLRVLQNLIMRKRHLISKKVLDNKRKKIKLSQRCKWSLDKLNELVRLIIKKSKSKNFKCVQTILDTKEWDQIAKKLDCGSGAQLKMFWMYRLSVQLTCKSPIYRNELRSELIKRIYTWIKKNRDAEEDWNNVDWKVLSKDLELSPFFLYRKFRKMAMTYVPMEKLNSVKDTVCHLHDNFLPILKSGKLKDYCLRRFKYDECNGLIEVD